MSERRRKKERRRARERRRERESEGERLTVWVSRELPQTNIAELVCVLRVGEELELLHVSDGLGDESN